MFIKQLYTACLSEAAYFIESNGEAAIIDPIRDIDVYLEMAEERNATIKYIFETHFHADFISGHLDLGKKTGAPIIFGPGAVTNYKVYNAKDGETFKIGALTIEVLHTPGHTPESSCYLLKDAKGKDHAVFTGDTLFIGDVGRPDLLGDQNLTKEQMASWLYDSLNNKIKPLADEVLVYPAHGPGSACGKNLSKETWSTIGNQKRNNYALQATSKADFVKQLTADLLPPPSYFAANARINKQGYNDLEEVIKNAAIALTPDKVEKQAKQNALILDTRHQDVFEQGFIPGAINIPIEGRFAEWVGILLKPEQPITLVTEPGKEKEAITRMARVGYENVIGYLGGGFEAWKKAGKEIDMVISIDAEEFALDYNHEKNCKILDVRKVNEYEGGHVSKSQNVPLQALNDNLDQIEENATLYVHCQGGLRSMMAASILKSRGFHNIRNVSGGYLEIVKTPVPVKARVAAEAN